MIVLGGFLVTRRGVIRNTRLACAGERFSASPPDRGDEVFDADGLYLCPGFVDIHTHGGYGCDFMDDDDDAFNRALRFHAEHGVTSVVPTSACASVPRILSMIKRTRRFQSRRDSFCRVLGAHLEGPYLSRKNKGAQNERCLRIPARDSYDFILRNADAVRRVTIAPELEGAAEMTAELTAAGILVSGGHDDGTASAALPAVKAGMRHTTHTWCAMSTVKMEDGRRKPGLCELCLSDDRLTAEIIADNHHMPPELVRMVYRCKGPEGACVVSDSLRAAGMPADGTRYTLGPKEEGDSQQFVVSDGVARLPDGSRYAGSIQPVSRMVRNLIADCGIPIPDAVMMGSLTPAKIIGAADEIGSVEPGKSADLCLMDRNFQVVHVMLKGKMIL